MPSCKAPPKITLDIASDDERTKNVLFTDRTH